MRELSRRAVAPLLALVLGCPTVASAQRGKKDVPEFTRQGLLIVNFTAHAGANLKMGKRAADAVRSRVGKLVNKKEVLVVNGGDIEYHLDLADYDPDGALSMSDIRAVGKYFRADEYLIAAVSNGPGGVRLSGALVMARDEKLRQPLPDAVAPKLDSAATLFARAIVAARVQLIPQRRCENALREGSGQRAATEARQGISLYARSAIARTCLVWTLRQIAAPSREVLDVANEILAIDSTSPHAMNAAAVALDSLRRRDEAATMWLRLAATDTADLELALRVSYSLLDGQNAKRAEPFIVQLAKEHPDSIKFVQLEWRAAYENKHWPLAIEAGEILLNRDSTARGDSTFYLHMSTAYRAANNVYKTVETLSHGVAAFPGDVRLYSMYTQTVRAETDTVVPRGLALFPKSAELLALNAKDLRSHGKIEESLDATKRALSLDSTMAQGQLVVAQLEIELGRPDSALVSLRRAVSTGEDSGMVAQFALSKGNTLYRAANTTKTSGDYSLAMRFFAFADSVQSTSQSQFLLGASALGVAQAALTEATKLTDKVESCRLAHLGSDLLPVARTGLTAGQDAFGDMAKQSLDYLGQLDPYAVEQIKAYCPLP